MGDPQFEFKNFKQRGEWVEMVFMARASREGLQVSKPYGDSAAYDFIVESGALCSRVQVKSTRSHYQKGFRANLRASMSRRYKPDSFDFAAIHVIPLDVWFIIPGIMVKLGILLTPGKGGFKVLRMRRSLALVEAARATALGPQHAGNEPDVIALESARVRRRCGR
jgi:PD-(D/E)XK endonuclease